jgi:abequosyltransferase
MNYPKLTIAIPTYNRESCLKECLKSIIDQDNDEVEIVISDNASDDNTEAVVRGYQKRTSRIQYCRNEKNIGFDANVLNAINCAGGEYIWLFGDDDIMRPGAIEKVLRILKSNANVSLIYLNYSIYSSDLKEMITPDAMGIAEDMIMDQGEQSLSMLGINLTFMSAMVMKRSVCLKVPNTERRVGNGFVHFYLALYVIKDNSSYFIAQPLLFQRSGNSLKDFKKYINFFVVEIAEIFKAVKPLGFSVSVVRRTISQSIKMYMIRKIANIKRTSPESLKGTLKILVRHYYSYPRFWIAVFPFYIIPTSLMKQIWSIYRSVIKRTSL